MITLALAALVLVVGVVSITWLAFRPDPETGLVDPIDGMALQAQPTPTEAPRPTAAPPEVELPGSVSVHAMEIVDADPGGEADSASDRERRYEDERVAAPTARATPSSWSEGRPPEPTPRSEPTVAEANDPTPRETPEASDSGDGSVVDHERREVEAAEAEALEEGMIVGDVPRTREGREIDPRTVEERRTAEEQARAAGGTTGRAPPDPTPTPAPVEEAPADLPSLRFLSAGVQPLGVPLSLRVRAEHFLASDVSVYYQWRGEGESGRRKRALRPQPDGSFALDIQASELRADRLQLWFVAEPGQVRAGTAGNPIEVKVR